MRLITFANLANIDLLINMKEIEHFDEVHSDGFLLTLLINLLSKKKIIRKSFDFTSLAKEIILHSKNKRIIFCGGSKKEMIAFKKNLQTYKNNIMLFINGYEEKSELLPAIKTFKPHIVVLSLGSGLQEKFAVQVKKCFKSKEILVYTSGAFISQTALRQNYYPAIVQFFGLRWAYRALHNSHVRKRLLNDYPRNFLRIIFDSKFRKKVFDLVS